jgi:hypothetical protein
MLPDDMPAPGQLNYPTLTGVQWPSELGERQKQHIDLHRDSRLRKNPEWIKYTMTQENYLQKDTHPTVPDNRQSKLLAKFANTHGLWDKLEGICQRQATHGECICREEKRTIDSKPVSTKPGKGEYDDHTHKP